MTPETPLMRRMKRLRRQLIKTDVRLSDLMTSQKERITRERSIKTTWRAVSMHRKIADARVITEYLADRKRRSPLCTPQDWAIDKRVAGTWSVVVPPSDEQDALHILRIAGLPGVF